MICVHCGIGKVSRPRRLCWNCYQQSEVRELYPSTSKYGWRGPNLNLFGAQPAMRPTNAPPGSPEKILVLARRAELGQELWHPHDATFAGPVLHGQAG
jgi:hypothetical protein